MRLGTLRTAGGLRAVLAAGAGRFIDINATQPELPNDVGSLLAVRPDALSRLRDLVAGGGGVEVPVDLRDLGPAVAQPGKVLCIGKNYADHIAELGGPAPPRPEVFMRARTSLAGPNDPLVRPRVTEQMDYEVELAVVIGRPCRYIAARDALDHVGGYCVFNDVSFRDYQYAGQQWTPGKNFDGSGPLGPLLVTGDEVPDPQSLTLSTTVLGIGGESEEVQRSSTSLMLTPIAGLISYLSSFTTLEPGDVIATGTPGGVALGRVPPRWLRPGETVVCQVEGLGELRNRIVNDRVAGGAPGL